MKTIYKYMPHYDGSFFDNYFLRATPRNELNDPFEFVPTRDFYEMAINYTEPGKDLTWLKKISYEQFCKNFCPFEGVISFSETRSNLLMWAHYCESHTGMVFEFDVTKNFFKDLKRVCYDNVKPNQIKSIEELFFIKSDSWIYEKEHRIVKKLSEHDFYIKKADLSINPGKKSATHIADECDEMYMFSVPKDLIKSVTFGCNTNEKIKDDILNKIIDDQEMNNIELWQTKLSKDYYYLEFEQI